MGDMKPSAEWRRSLLHQPSMNSKTAILASGFVVKVRRLRHSTSSVEKKLSQIALSWPSPTDPIEGRAPFDAMRLTLALQTENCRYVLRSDCPMDKAGNWLLFLDLYLTLSPGRVVEQTTKAKGESKAPREARLLALHQRGRPRSEGYAGDR